MVKEKLAEALRGFMNIAAESRGVDGYHLNGDSAEWEGFPEVEAATQALAELASAPQQEQPLGAPIAAEYAAELAMLSTDAEALQEQYERGLKDGAQQAQAPGPSDSQMLDWLALNSKTCTVHMNLQHPYKPNHKIMAMTGPTYRDAIRAAMRGAAPQGDKP